MTENEISKLTIELCLKIHKTLGPGLLESAYEDCLAYELHKKNIPFERQKRIPLIYDGHELGEGFVADIIIENKVILELKSVKELESVHYAQLNTYLKLTHLKLGMLINFGEKRVMNGVHRIVNGL